MGPGLGLGLGLRLGRGLGLGSRQSGVPETLAKVPAGQGALFSAPRTHAEPGGQVKQSACTFRPVRLPKVPGEQRVVTAADSGQYPPSSHSSQSN